MNALTIIALAIAALAGLALWLTPPAGRALRKAADAEFLADLGTEDEPPVPAPCPHWCDIVHPAPGPDQMWLVHRGYVADQQLGDGTCIEVTLHWSVPVSGPVDGRPVVHLCVEPPEHTGQETTITPLRPDQAGDLAVAMAVTRGGVVGAWGAALAGEAGGLPQMLARATVYLGYLSCEGCGVITADVRDEFDRVSGEQVARCGSCHQDALAGAR